MLEVFKCWNVNKLDFSEKKIKTMKMSRRTFSMSAVAHTEETDKNSV